MKFDGSCPSKAKSGEGLIRSIIATDALRGWVGGDLISRGEVWRRESNMEWILSAPWTSDANSVHQLYDPVNIAGFTWHYGTHDRVQEGGKSMTVFVTFMPKAARRAMFLSLPDTSWSYMGACSVSVEGKMAARKGPLSGC